MGSQHAEEGRRIQVSHATSTFTEGTADNGRASNASHCEWSADGHYILTATLSPRLRVDNGVKIWWCGGQLLHIHNQDELYQATFQPALLSNTPSFPSVMPSAPEPNPSVALYRPKGETSTGGESAPESSLA